MLKYVWFIWISAASAQTLSLRLSQEPATLDWNKAQTSVETYLLMNLMEGLVGVDEKLKVVPAIAKRWEISKQGTEYTFYLNDVKWSDGRPLSAEDFVYGWKRLLSPTTAAPYAYLLFDVVGAQKFHKGEITDFSKVGVTALNEKTLKVTLERPIAYWIYLPSFWVTFPVRQDLIERHGLSWTKPGKMQTVGPFILDAYEIGSLIRMKRNPYAPKVSSNVTEIDARIVVDDATAVNLYKTGKLDIVPDLAQAALGSFKGSPELRRFPYLKTGYLGFKIGKYPISDRNVRAAFAQAIEKKKISLVLGGEQRPATSFVPEPLMGFSPKSGLAFNPKEAKKLLNLSSWQGKGAPLELLLPNTEKTMALAQFLQSEFKKHLGVEIRLQAFDHKTFRAQLELDSYGIYLLSWGADYPDADNFLSIFLESAGNNYPRWKNPVYDALVLEARGTMNTAKREKAYFEAQKILLDQEVVVIPLFYEPNTLLVRSRIKNLTLNPLNTLELKKVELK